MVESKQVRVDNWGIFFLQRLQVFFSKTDYCDLTLQFEGNVQLKVHRLVMCACTEYFTHLEQSCPALEENTIMMPPDLQADVIVPIVNFMYTGMLEFHMSIFDRLYKAAELMNITVLTKLLDAQKVHPNYKSLKKKPESPHIWNLQGPKPAPKVHKSPELPPPLPGRKLPIWKRKTVPSVPMQHPTSHMQFSEPRFPQDPLSVPDSTPKPTRFEWPDEDLPQLSLMDTSFEEISYTSKPLLTQEEEIRASTSFDDVRKSANNEQNKDDGDRNDYSQQKRKLEQTIEKSSPKRMKLNDKENKEATISIKSSNGADLDHTKIVSEILKKYPQLVKKNKNIRLKIMASGNKNVMEQTVHAPVKTPKMKVQVEAAKTKITKPVQKIKVEKRNATEDGPWVCTKCDEAGEPSQEFVLYYLYRKHMTDVHNETFDARLCKYCGQWCGKHNLMMYHLYTKHGLKPPTTYNFPKCDQCPYIALSAQKLSQHKLRHDSSEMQCADCNLAFTSQQTLTAHIQITGHLNRSGTSSYDCQYCTKRLQSAINLFSHIKNSHLKEAKRDGIVILDEMEEVENDVEEEDAGVPKDKVKIISNVKVQSRSEQANTSLQQTTQLEASSEAEALSNVASGIATSLGLVDIVVLDDNQQYILQQQEDHSGQPEFIIPDLTTGENHFAGQVITTQHSAVLPQSMLQTTGGDITSTDELVMVLTDHDYQDEQEGTTTDNSNIVVLYSHPVDGQQGQFIASQGNLLVNSQTGMLEIRNEGITTTTPNQMVVNSSVDAPESIESIQREIQSHRDMKRENYYEDEVKNNTVQLPQVNSTEIQPQQSEEQPVEREEATVPKNVDQGTATENYQEEEEEEPPTESTEENKSITMEVEKEESSKEVETAEEPSNTEEDASNKDQNDSVDAGAAPTDEFMETEEIDQELTPEDPEKDEKQALPDQENSGEDLEVKTRNMPQLEETNSADNVEGEDIPPPNKENFAESVPLCDTSADFVFNDPDKLGELESSDTGHETAGNVEENVSEPMEVDGKTTPKEEHENELKPPENSEEQAEEPGKCKDAERNENEDGASMDVPDRNLPQEEAFESEYQHQSETDNSQYNEDEDDNSQSSQGTVQSQETSMDNRNQGNIDQAILEDWEDTDSQQSEKQRAAMKQAAENVNKLMDDWEEEDDEDDKKEGD